MVKSIGTKCRKPSQLCATFLSSTHPTGPSSIDLIHSSHSFWNDFSVIIQNFPGISVVIFLSDLALLLHSFCFPFQEEVSLICLKSFLMKTHFFFSLLGVPGQPVHLPPDEFNSKWRNIMLDGFSCRRSPGATYTPHKWVCTPGRGQYWISRTEWQV